MKNKARVFYAMLLLVFVLLYVYFEYSMYNAKSGLGLGVYLIYLGVLLVHGVFLVISYIVRRFKKRIEGEILLSINTILVLLLLFRLLVFVYIT